MSPKVSGLPLKFVSKGLRYEEIEAARDLIERQHYQDGKIIGEFVLAFADAGELAKLKPDFHPVCTRENLCLVGAAVVKSGIAYSNPRGRRDLAEKKFPHLKFDRLDRGEIVQQMGLALISRVAVEPELQSLGIGCSLARECRRQAPSLVPGSKYVEVMTSQRLQDAQKLLTKEGSRRDFLQAAGFRLVPKFTKNQKPKQAGRDRRLYYWAGVIS